MKGYGSSALGRLGDMRQGDNGNGMGMRAFMDYDDEGNPLEATEEKQVDTDFFNGRAPASYLTPQRNPHHHGNPTCATRLERALRDRDGTCRA